MLFKAADGGICFVELVGDIVRYAKQSEEKLINNPVKTSDIAFR